ncbi:MAG: UDP-N-acetylglucosamine 2-epimerase (non-hydrolyzing) [Candidatus Nealsonbacteria bacterium]|nr:MAG: UDP-N-acetylglucosamine 2-epimerase (non-hydrolyzing) [Candidatus Nealsonbacteria bacterium]
MKKKIKLLLLVGARPNFIKAAPLIREVKKHRQIELVMVHSGQHYDFEMSKIFFDELKISKPNYNLKVGSGSHAYQTAETMKRLEPILLKEKPNLVIVVGDVNSTLAAALTATKTNIPVTHIEAGLRSFDMAMPEEVNRRLTDHMSSFLFVTEPSGIKNLVKEGISKNKIFFVGNIMIDTLLDMKSKAQKIKILEALKLKKKAYGVLTLHRPENVADEKVFKDLLAVIEEIQRKIKIIWPIHPRVKRHLKEFNFLKKIKKMKNLLLIKPLGYLEMLTLNKEAKFVLTDSGGIQEETTVLNIPCLTLRKNTERPVTVQKGTNVIVGNDRNKIIKELSIILKGKYKKRKVIKFWDGHTAERIVKILISKLS